MADLLTAKDLQALLQADRSTIYRLAEANRLPAIKVGKQWHFPTDQIESWLQGQAVNLKRDAGPPPNGTGENLASRSRNSNLCYVLKLGGQPVAPPDARAPASRSAN